MYVSFNASIMIYNIIFDVIVNEETDITIKMLIICNINLFTLLS